MCERRNREKGPNIEVLDRELERAAFWHEFPVQAAYLTDLSSESVAILSGLAEVAFGKSVGDSIQTAHNKGLDQVVYVSTQPSLRGFVILDCTLRDKGIYYVELAAVVDRGNGLGSLLHVCAFKHIPLQTTSTTNMVLVLTQNPAEIAAFRNGSLECGTEVFPFDRQATNSEIEAVHTWIENGPMRHIASTLSTDISKGIIYNAYRNWQLTHPLSIKTGFLSEYLAENGIDYSEFCELGHAFIVGSSPPAIMSEQNGKDQ